MDAKKISRDGRGKEGEIVVLTGAAGCLGFHVLKLLVSLDDSIEEVRCLDLRKPEELMIKLINKEQEELVKKTKRRKQLKWIQGDIRDINVVERTLEGADCVIHCAAKIDAWTHVNDQDVGELESINIDGTENLLKSSIRFGISKFIHISSFEVYIAFDTIYYATETTLPDNKWFLFGTSGSSKREAENKVKQYSSKKLSAKARNDQDALNSIIIRLPPLYGEFDRHFVSKLLEAGKFFGGRIRRMDNLWIRHQPLYVGNAAWAIIKAKQRMDKDQSISGEEFHITDETPIGDPFDFFEPFLNCKGMQLSKSGYPFIACWILLWLFFALKTSIQTLDIFGLFSRKHGRLEEAIERDRMLASAESSQTLKSKTKTESKRWFNYLMPQTLGFICNSSFLNRTKASLRLDYEPLIEPDEAHLRSIEWYKNHLEL